ncbi:MAG: hypothetical protein GKR87_12750 [Kiritimatiellae bacterium]|nr:hypothetical protein [Kiritimatiellia bacterium]
MPTASPFDLTDGYATSWDVTLTNITNQGFISIGIVPGGIDDVIDNSLTDPTVTGVEEVYIKHDILFSLVNDSNGLKLQFYRIENADSNGITYSVQTVDNLLSNLWATPNPAYSLTDVATSGLPAGIEFTETGSITETNEVLFFRVLIDSTL